jgi:hypothetical protein
MEQTRSSTLRRDVLTSIYLDYGADSQQCQLSDLKISERGMEFKARWQFQVGTQLEITFAYHDLFGRLVKTPVEGIVVDCEEIEGAGFAHLLIFPEISPEVRASLRGLRRGGQPARALSLN